jgi:hypothetical protein
VGAGEGRGAQCLLRLVHRPPLGHAAEGRAAGEEEGTAGGGSKLTNCQLTNCQNSKNAGCVGVLRAAAAAKIAASCPT